MKYNYKILSLYFLVLLFISCSGYSGKYHDLTKDYEELLAEKSICNEKMEVLEDLINESKLAYDDIIPTLKNDLKASEHNLVKTKKELEELRQSLVEAEESFDALSDQYQSVVASAANIVDYQEVVVYDRVDSINVVYPKPNRSSVSIYCPESMRENISYKVFAMVKPLFEDEAVKQELLKLVNEVREERRESLISIEDIESKEIMLGRYIKIELKDYDDNFDIVIPKNYPDSESPVDIYDENSDNYFNDQFLWRWNVTPKENTYGPASLEFVITPLDKDLKPMDPETRFYKIDIDLKQSFLNTVWERANRNPEWAIASIITPFLTFLAGFFAKKKKGEKAVNKNEAEA